MAQTGVMTKLKRFYKAIEENGIRVNKIILYGSHASGKFHKDSDIDVAVISPDFGKDRFEEGVKLRRIAGKIDYLIEPVPLSTKSYKKDTWVPLIYEIRTKGIEIKLDK